MWLEAIQWNAAGLIPVITQQVGSNDVLMLAWMNQEALLETVKSGCAVYWSRSRNKLWRKGETSGQIQYVHEIRLDCDSDAILLKVNQEKNIACHTGRHSCFFRKLKPYPLNQNQTQIANNRSHKASPWLLNDKSNFLKNEDYHWIIVDSII